MLIEDAMDLADWRRQTFDMYREIRLSPHPAEAWTMWTGKRSRLFRTHPQSPIPETTRDSFEGPSYFPYDPQARVLATVSSAPSRRYDIATSGTESFAFTRFGVATFELTGRSHDLELYWLDGYGGGIFLPFKDSTSGA